jgi:hypothetical protein
LPSAKSWLPEGMKSHTDPGIWVEPASRGAAGFDKS